MAPEQINDSKYNEKADIWSAGCIIYETASLRAPFEATTHYALAKKIKSGQLDRIPSTYTDDLMNVIQSMIQQDPEKRPSADDILQHPQISVRSKDKKHKEYYANLKKKEGELEKKEKVIKEKYEDNIKKLKELKEKEERLQLLEK